MDVGTLNTGGEILYQLNAAVENPSKIIAHGQLLDLAGNPTKTLEEFGIRNQDTMLQIYGMGATFRSKGDYGHLYPVDIIEDAVMKNMDRLKPLLDFEWELAEKVGPAPCRYFLASTLTVLGFHVHPPLPAG